MVSFLARALLAELLVSETFLISYVIAFRLLGRESTLLRWVGVVVCGTLFASIGFHLLCAAGAFHAVGAALSLSVLTAVILRSYSGGALGRWLARDARFVGRLYQRGRRSPYRWVVSAFCIASLPIVLRPLILPPLAWDTLTYHAVKAAMWVQHAGALRMRGPGTWAYYADLWGGGEVFTSWAMLPFHSDLLAMAVDVVEWLALGFALLALARELGIREPYASAAAGFALAVPTLRISVGSGYVEVALLMMAFSGWALAVRFLERGSRGAFYLSLGAMGVAAGIKFPFLPLSLLTVAAASVRAIALRARGGVRLLDVVAGIALFGAILAPWPWHAYRHTGFPFSPLPVELFGMRLGKPTPEVEWYMDRSDSAHEGSELALLGRALVEERMGPGATTMIAVAVSLVAWPFLWGRHALALVLLVSTVVGNWVEYYAPGLSIVRRYFTSSGVRFLLPALLLSVILSVAFCRRHPRAGRLYLLFLIGGTFFQLLLYTSYGWSTSSAGAMVPLLAGLCGVVAATRWIARARAPVGVRLGAISILLAVALLGLGRLRDDLRLDLFRGEYMIHPIHPYWLPATALVDPPDWPRRIAVTSGPMQDLDNWVVYPFLGRVLQNDALYVPISRDGTIHHFGSGNRNAEYARRGDFPSWEARLRKLGVTEVMSFRPASVELRWMESHPAAFRRLAGETGDWGLFAVVNRPLAGSHAQTIFARCPLREARRGSPAISSNPPGTISVDTRIPPRGFPTARPHRAPEHSSG